MAWRRSLSTTATLSARRLRPSFSHIHRDDRNDSVCSSPSIGPSQPPTMNSLPRTFSAASSVFGAQSVGGWHSLPASPMGVSPSLCRYMSGESGDSSYKIDDFVVEVSPAEVMNGFTSQAPAVREVAAAAADSAYPVAALQHIIDAVHSFTGLNWWASIALTTVLIRGATVPLLINQLRSTTKLSLMRPHLEDLNAQFTQMATADPDAVSKHQQRVMALFKEYGVSPFTPLKGLLIQGPIFVSFFLAIRNMAEKVPSFHTGGTLWFVDLTTPDSLFILPVLTSLTFWITVECNMQEGMEGNPIAGTMKKFGRIFAVVAIPIMMSFPKAIFGYWLTSNLFSLTYGLVMRQPGVKKFLNIPEIPVSPASASQQDASPFSLFQQNVSANSEPLSTTEPLSTIEPSKTGGRKISSSAVLRQRLRSLEKKIKKQKQR